MPIIKSAKKRVRQEAKANQRNTAQKRQLKSDIKALEAAIAGGKKAETKKALDATYSALDTAVKKNLMHKNKAARKKSALAAQAKPVLGKTSKKTPAKKAETTS